MDRREFLALGLGSAAVLCGLLPRRVCAATTSVSLGGAASGFTSYVDDVFSTYLYVGTGATQVINNGIDLAGQGGLVWIKSRSIGDTHALYDTVRTRNKVISTAIYGTGTNAEFNVSAGGDVASFNSNGFTLGYSSSMHVNDSDTSTVAWSFRRAANFFDVVTYVGDGANSRTISHSLNISPGFVMVKRTDSTGDWWAGHKDTNSGNGQWFKINTSDPGTYSGAANPTVSYFSFAAQNFTVSSGWGATPGYPPPTNINGASYVAYIFAHDPGANGIIQCGTFTTDGSGAIPKQSLGWEPQYLLMKTAAVAGDWTIYDDLRGSLGNYATGNTLVVNSSASEQTSSTTPSVDATGFYSNSNWGANRSYIYIAIRRSNKPPTSGAQVFSAQVITGNGSATFTQSAVAPFSPDLISVCFTNQAYGSALVSRLTYGQLYCYSAQAENRPPGDIRFGRKQGEILAYGQPSNTSWIHHFFRRAPGFFDVVGYIGTNTINRSVSHSLGAIPELMIAKRRTTAGGNWCVYSAALGPTKYLALHSTGGATLSSSVWQDTLPTASNFTVGSTLNDASTETYAVFLFATVAGVSKVGSYTGNGGSQTINCGFASGARFILIKRTDSAGEWYMWDTTRGIGSGNDPHLSLNSLPGEASDDSVDPDSSGFIVNQIAATNINVTNGVYIFMAIS